MKKLNVFINGKEVESKSNEFLEVVNPSTEKVIAEVPNCNSEDVEMAVNAAEKAYEVWGQTTPNERSKALLELADIVEKNIDHLTTLESENVGKPLENARGEISGFIDTLKFFAGAARNLNGLNTGEYSKGYTSMIRREPIGVIGSITPWNYPLMMAGWKIAPALAAGNTVVLKPSELTPLSTLYLAQIASKVLGPGVLNVITGNGETVGSTMTNHPKINMISLTGSVRAGKAVAKEAADSLKKVHLELGGKAPVIVFNDANISQVVNGLVKGVFANGGQDCTAATRLYVSDKIYNELMDKLIIEVKKIKVGDPLLKDTMIGPLVSKEHLTRVNDFVNRAKKSSHIEVITGGSIINKTGFYFQPTILSGVDQSDEVMQDEVFGPVLAVSKFKDEEEFIALANDCKYALAASVWTKNIDRAMKAIKKLEFGTVWVNDHLPLVSEMPHGGFKLSGYGNDQSVYSLEEYMEIKHAMIKFN